MSEPLIECVPNLSEGRDARSIHRFSETIQSVAGVQLLHCDAGVDAHRTVLTFAGSPKAMLEASFQLARVACENIDLRQHRGMHPRMGALDVCPFVPLSAIGMSDCVRLSEELGQRVAAELNIPVYLYEHSSRAAHRRILPDVRRGEFEGLEEKLLKPEWAPDFGSAQPHPSAGALITGARDFLLAFNVNLNTDKVEIARAVAAEIRTSGVKRRNPDGSVLLQAGRLKACRAIGWLMPTYGCAQVSMNLYDLGICGARETYDACCEEAEKLGAKVTGSELIGMIPLSALQKVGNLPPDCMDHSRLLEAARSIGLMGFRDFSLEERVLEFAMQRHGLTGFAVPLAGAGPR